VYKSILKTIWPYGVLLWGSAPKSNIEILWTSQSKVLLIFTDASWYVLNAVISRDLQVLSVGQEVRNYSVTYRQNLTDLPNSLARSLFQRPNYNTRLKRYYPADLATRFNWYSATPPQTIPNNLWLDLNTRCANGCISYMPIIVTVSTIAVGRCSSVGIATELRPGRSGIEFRWGRDFSPVQTGPGAHPASCRMDTGSFFPGVEAAGACGGPPPNLVSKS